MNFFLFYIGWCFVERLLKGVLNKLYWFKLKDRCFSWKELFFMFNDLKVCLCNVFEEKSEEEVLFVGILFWMCINVFFC